MTYEELKDKLSTMKWGGIYIGVLAYYKEHAPEFLDLKVAEISNMTPKWWQRWEEVYKIIHEAHNK